MKTHNGFLVGNRERLLGGTCPLIRPRGIYGRQRNMGPEYRPHATRDETFRVVENAGLNRDHGIDSEPQ